MCVVTLKRAAGFLVLFGFGVGLERGGWGGAARAEVRRRVGESAHASLSRLRLQSPASPPPLPLLSHNKLELERRAARRPIAIAPRVRAPRQEEEAERRRRKEGPPPHTRKVESELLPPSSLRAAGSRFPLWASPGSPAVARSSTRRPPRPGALIAVPHVRGARAKKSERTSEEEALSPPPNPTLLFLSHPPRARPLAPAFPLPTPLLPTSLRHATA
jgi:hypothetical protein